MRGEPRSWRATSRAVSRANAFPSTLHERAIRSRNQPAKYPQGSHERGPSSSTIGFPPAALEQELLRARSGSILAWGSLRSGRSRARTRDRCRAGRRRAPTSRMCRAMSRSRTRHSVSTRRSRLRSIRSALPMYTLRPAAVREVVDARVLEEAADDRAHANRLADARHARAEAAHAAHDHVDRDAGLRRAVERPDDRRIGDARCS